MAAVSFEDYFVRNEARSSSELLGTLSATHRLGSIQTTVRSRKWGNVLHNWKKFTYEALPVGVIAGTAIPTSIVGAVFQALLAIKIAIDATEIEFSEDASEVILRLASMQRIAEQKAERPAWIRIDALTLESNLPEENLRRILRNLEHLKVVCIDLKGEHVTIVEEICFESGD